MKLFMNKNEKYEEPEVHMFFHKQTKEVEPVSYTHLDVYKRQVSHASEIFCPEIPS